MRAAAAVYVDADATRPRSWTANDLGGVILCQRGGGHVCTIMVNVRVSGVV